MPFADSTRLRPGLTRAQRKELALIAALWLRAWDGTGIDWHGERETVRKLLLDAYAAPFEDLMIGRTATAERVRHLCDGIADRARFADRLGLVAYFLTRWLVDADYLVLADDALGTAIANHCLPALEKAAGDQVAFEMARRLALREFRALQEDGLFEGVRIRVAARPDTRAGGGDG